MCCHADFGRSGGLCTFVWAWLSNAQTYIHTWLFYIFRIFTARMDVIFKLKRGVFYFIFHRILLNGLRGNLSRALVDFLVCKAQFHIGWNLWQLLVSDFVWPPCFFSRDHSRLGRVLTGPEKVSPWGLLVRDYFRGRMPFVSLLRPRVIKELKDR